MLNCVGNKYKSTYQDHYMPFAPGSSPMKAEKIPQPDEMLINGHFINNLQVNGVPICSKVWTKPKADVEEYKNYLIRLSQNNKEMFKLYFNSQGINIKLVEKMLRDLEKSTYQSVYSANQYVPRKEACRFPNVQQEQELTNMEHSETTYGNYYNRYKDLEQMNESLYGHFLEERKDPRRVKPNKFYRTGITTYQESICVPAIAMSETKKLLNGPIDRYTHRKT